MFKKANLRGKMHLLKQPWHFNCFYKSLSYFMKYCDLRFMSLVPECYTSQWKSTRCATEQVYIRKAIHMHRGTLMHRLSRGWSPGTYTRKEAHRLQGNYIFQIIIYMGVCSSDKQHCVNKLTHSFQRHPGCSCLYSEWFSLGLLPTQFV